MSSVGSVTSSPARSSISASLVGPSSVAAAVGGDDFHFPADLISIQDRKDEALRGQYIIRLTYFPYCLCKRFLLGFHFLQL